jgi:hypothetical protein
MQSGVSVGLYQIGQYIYRRAAQLALAFSLLHLVDNLIWMALNLLHMLNYRQNDMIFNEVFNRYGTAPFPEKTLPYQQYHSNDTSGHAAALK